MTAIGDAISLTINGVRYAIPKDTEPNVIKGGDKITDTQEYGDGTADSYVSKVIPKITGLRVKISKDNSDAFEQACGTPDIPIILTCVQKSYELTGSVVGEIEISATRGMTGEFEVHATDGTGIRET